MSQAQNQITANQIQAAKKLLVE